MRFLLAILALSTSAFGQSTLFRIQKFCELGGQTVTTQGLHSVTNVQRSFPSCTITVYLTGTTTVAAIYSDNLATPTPLANPYTANTDGSFGFYADQSSCYDVVTSGGNPGNTFPAPFTYSNICQGGSGGGGGGPSVTCPGAVNGGLAAWLSPTSLGCDNNSLTDFAGHLSAQSFQAVGPHNGEVWLTSDAIVSPDALPAGTFAWVVPNVFSTPVRVNVFGPGTDGQVLQQLSHSTDASGTQNIFLNWLTPSTGSGTVTSVGLAGPTGFQISGSPVTTSGTLTFAMPASWATGDLLLGNGSNSVARLAIGTNNFCLVSNGTTAAWAACPSSGGGSSKVPFDSCMPDGTLNPGNAYWRAVTYVAAAGVTSADIGSWEYAVNATGTVICKLEIPSNASGTMHVFLDVSALDSVAGHTAAFKVCYSVSSSQNINNLTYTCTATQNYTSTATAYANTRLDFTIASATVGEYLVANIVQNSGGTNTNPARVVSKVKVF